MAVTINGHWEVDGLLMGRGTAYPVEAVQGLGVPDPKDQDRDLPIPLDGSWAGVDAMGTREVVMAFGIDGDPESEDYDEAIEAVANAWRPRSSDVVVSFQRFGRRRRFYARPRGLILPQDDDFHLGAARGAGRLIAHDPLIYDDDETVESGASEIEATNAGTWPTWPTVTITNPGSSVVLTNHDDDSKTVILSGLSGDAVIDFRRRLVTVDGDSEFGALGMLEWWRVMPGANEIEVSGADSVSVTFRSAWTRG